LMTTMTTTTTLMSSTTIIAKRYRKYLVSPHCNMQMGK